MNFRPSMRDLGPFRAVNGQKIWVKAQRLGRLGVHGVSDALSVFGARKEAPALVEKVLSHASSPFYSFFTNRKEGGSSFTKSPFLSFSNSNLSFPLEEVVIKMLKICNEFVNLPT